MGLLTGRVALITGASSGIGAASARLFAAEGAQLVLAARRLDRIAALARQIESDGGAALACQADLTKEEDVEALFAALMARYGRIDTLVNNAGIADDTPIEEMTLDTWRRVLDSNLTSAFLCARAAFGPMRAQGRGRIINIGSTAARMPRENSPAYTASKFGIEGLTRSLVLDGRGHGITASIIHPGSTISELSDAARAAEPSPRIMATEDVARVILLVASLPDGSNMYETLILPIGMPFFGRG